MRNEWEWKANTNFTVHQILSFKVKCFKIYGTQLFSPHNSIFLHFIGSNGAESHSSQHEVWVLLSSETEEEEEKLII